jgi:aminoglycoside 2''-phosphotransferase
VPADDYCRIIAACFPELPIGTCRLISQGWDSVAVAVDDELLFRFPKRADVVPQYRMEARLLPVLTKHVSLPVPRFAYIWQGGRAYDRWFVGYPMLPGRQLSHALLAALDADRLAAQLGQFVSELHSFSVEQAARLLFDEEATAGSATWATRWWDRYRDLYADIQARVFPLLSAAQKDRVGERWKAFFADEANLQFQPALIHHDLNEEHILVDAGGIRITGIIDWGDAGIGDPAIDFTGLLADYGRSMQERVLRNYSRPVDAAFRRRAEFYRSLIPFHEVLFGLSTGQAGHVEHGLAGITI